MPPYCCPQPWDGAPHWLEQALNKPTPPPGIARSKWFCPRSPPVLVVCTIIFLPLTGPDVNVNLARLHQYYYSISSSWMRLTRSRHSTSCSQTVPTAWPQRNRMPSCRSRPKDSGWYTCTQNRHCRMRSLRSCRRAGCPTCRTTGLAGSQMPFLTIRKILCSSPSISLSFRFAGH
jgi:hypothetical protein